MNSDNVVECWCCAYFWQYDEDERIYCKLKNVDISLHDTVCADFLLNKGLHTGRTIPDYCKNYSKKDGGSNLDPPKNTYKF